MGKSVEEANLCLPAKVNKSPDVTRGHFEDREALGNCIHKGLKEQKSPEPVTTCSQGRRGRVENVTDARGVG